MSIQDLSPETLRRGADLKEQIADLHRQLDALWNGNVPRRVNGKHQLSPAGRKRIADAQRKRWRAYNKQKGKK